MFHILGLVDSFPVVFTTCSFVDLQPRVNSPRGLIHILLFFKNYLHEFVFVCEHSCPQHTCGGHRAICSWCSPSTVCDLRVRLMSLGLEENSFPTEPFCTPRFYFPSTDTSRWWSRLPTAWLYQSFLSQSGRARFPSAVFIVC